MFLQSGFERIASRKAMPSWIAKSDAIIPVFIANAGGWHPLLTKQDGIHC